MISNNIPTASEKWQSIEELTHLSRQIRATCVHMSFISGEGHLSSALSYVDILVALYFKWLNISPELIDDPNRDHFILSKGHGCTSWYATLAAKGFIPLAWLHRYAQEHSPLPNHPCRHALPIIDTSAGSLGQGLGIATGILCAHRIKGITSPRVVVLLGDGECNEGSVWESAMFAAAQRLDHLVAIVDYNNVQAVGNSDTLMGHTSLAEKFQAFGWNAREIDGNNITEIIDTLQQIPFAPGSPSVIVAKTKTGVSFMDGQVLWHYRKPSADEYQAALLELDAYPLHTLHLEHHT